MTCNVAGQLLYPWGCSSWQGLGIERAAISRTARHTHMCNDSAVSAEKTPVCLLAPRLQRVLSSKPGA